MNDEYSLTPVGDSTDPILPEFPQGNNNDRTRECINKQFRRHRRCKKAHDWKVVLVGWLLVGWFPLHSKVGALYTRLEKPPQEDFPTITVSSSSPNEEKEGEDDAVVVGDETSRSTRAHRAFCLVHRE